MLEYDTVKLKGTAVQLRAFSTLWSTQDGAVFLLLPNELLEITGCPPRPTTISTSHYSLVRID